MDLFGYLNVCRRRWRTIFLVFVLAVGVAGAYTAWTEATYQARAELYVSTVSAENPSDLAQGSTFTQRQVTSYAEVATTPLVLQPVITELSLDTTPAELAQQVDATAPVGTVLLTLTAQDPDPDQALLIAGAVSDQMVLTLGELDQVDSTSTSPVKATVVTPASVTSTPVSPKPVRNIGVAAVFGLLAGLALAVIRDRADSSIRTREDIDGVCEAPVLGGIMFDKAGADQANLVIDQPHHQQSEAFRTLRTNLQFLRLGDPPRSIVITSSLPGEGKTTTTAHLAQALAEGGKSVCLVEGDLRRPRLLQYLGMEGGAGLTNVLIGEADLDDMLQPYGQTSLRLLGAGPIPPNPAELLGSEPMQELVHRLEERFDTVIVDSPPLLPVTDAAVLSRVTDGALMVVGIGVVSTEHLRAASERLERAHGPLLGLIMNRLPRTGADAYGAYGEYGAYEPDSSEQDVAASAQKLRLHHGSATSQTTV